MQRRDPAHRAPEHGPAEAGLPLVDAEREPELAALLSRASSALAQPPDELTARRHRRGMQQALRRRTGIQGGGPLRFAGTAAGVAAILVVTLAGLGTLPEPAQLVMADMAGRVGIDLPRPIVDGAGDTTDRPMSRGERPGPDARPETPTGDGATGREDFAGTDEVPNVPGRVADARPDAPAVTSRDERGPSGPAQADPRPSAEPGAPADLPATDAPTPRSQPRDAPPLDDPPGHGTAPSGRIDDSSARGSTGAEPPTNPDAADDAGAGTQPGDPPPAEDSVPGEQPDRGEREGASLAEDDLIPERGPDSGPGGSPAA